MPIQPKVFPLGAWTPDAPDMSADGVVVASNCVPSQYGYKPFQEYVSQTTALGARARGAILTRDTDDAVFQYAGDATKLYQNVSGTWTDKSKVGGYTVGTEDVWEMIRWKDQILATNYTDNPQSITLGAALFADLTTALRIKHWDVVRQFIVAGYTEDAVDGEVPWRVRWSAFNDPTSWTPDPSTLSDFEDLPQRKIQRVFGGEFGIIMQDTAITRMSFVGSPVVFQFDEVIRGVGLLAPGAAVRLGSSIFFLSKKGFYELIAGSQVKPIGFGKVDDRILADLDQSNLHMMTAAADVRAQRVMFGYPGQGSSGGIPNKILVYDVITEQWSELLQEHELLWTAAGAAITLEGLDVPYPNIDTMSITLDSPTFIGGVEQLAMFDTVHKSGFFDGDKRTAILTTREYMFDGQQRVRLRGFRPLVEGDSVEITARVGTREQPDDEPSYTSELSRNSGGRICCRTNSRFHRIELTVGGEWSKAFGVMVESRDLGPGGRRG